MDGTHSLSYCVKGELHFSWQLLAELAVLGHGNLGEQLLDKGQFGSFSNWFVLRIEVHVLTEAKGQLKVAVSFKKRAVRCSFRMDYGKFIFRKGSCFVKNNCF